jgi:hypothetical protein
MTTRCTIGDLIETIRGLSWTIEHGRMLRVQMPETRVKACPLTAACLLTSETYHGLDDAERAGIEFGLTPEDASIVMDAADSCYLEADRLNACYGARGIEIEATRDRLLDALFGRTRQEDF